MGIVSFKSSQKAMKTSVLNKHFLFQGMPTRPSIGRPDETYGTKTRLTTISIRLSKVCHTTAATSRANMDIIVPDFFQKFCNRKSGITLFEFLIPLQFEDDFQILRFGTVIQKTIVADFLKT